MADSELPRRVRDTDELRMPAEESANPLEHAEEEMEEEASSESESTLSTMFSSLEEDEEDYASDDELFEIWYEVRRRYFKLYGAGDGHTGRLNNIMINEPRHVVMNGHGDHGDHVFISIQRPQMVRQEQIIVPPIVTTEPSTSSSREDAESEESEMPQLEENMDISGPNPTPESIEVVEEDLVYCSPLCAAVERLFKTIGAKSQRACQSVRKKLKKFFQRKTAASSSKAPACSRSEQRREDSTADVSLREQVESESVEGRLTLKQRLRALRFPKFKILRNSTRVQPV